MKQLLDRELAHENLLNILGGHGELESIFTDVSPTLEMAIYVLKNQL